MDNLAEVKFQEWLKNNKIPYWYIDQSFESFSPSLKKYLIKRPDFMILLPNLGFILVDVKNKEQLKKYSKFSMYAEEVDSYLRMQRTFNLQMWFAISHKKYHYKTWFWIPCSEVTRAGFVYESKEKKEKYYSVPVEEFVQVSDTDNLQRIFNKLFR